MPWCRFLSVLIIHRRRYLHMFADFLETSIIPSAPTRTLLLMFLLEASRGKVLEADYHGITSIAYPNTP